MSALDIDSTGERVAYLDTVCGGDAQLKSRVQALLRRHEEMEGMLDVPPPGISVTPPTRESHETVGTIIGRYQPLELIGEGSFGDVYMAEQQEPVRRNVALKIIKLGMDTRQVIARFEAERQTLALMDHPNIAKVLDAGATDTGRPYFVMDLVRGMPITEYCDVNKLTTRDRLKLFIEVCHAVQHAHQKGIIHRDLKPTNMLVTDQDGQPVPKIIDFGVAKATQQRLTEKTLFTQRNQLIGTPEYMSPEQATFGETDVDTRSDIYSLGVLLYELTVGTTPFESEDLHNRGYDEICRVIRESEPLTPSRRLSTLGDEAADVCQHRQVRPAVMRKILCGDLDWIVMKCLEKDRSRRYESASSLATALTCFLNHEPVDARPPSVGYRLRKFAYRNKVAAVATAAVLLTLLIGIAGTTIGMIRATQAGALAEQERRRAETHLARMQLERGVRLLNEGDTRGLLSLLDARQTGDAVPGIRNAAGSMWAIAHDVLPYRLEQVLPTATYSDLSPDGNLLVTEELTKTRMWNLATGQPHSQTLDMGRVVSAVLFSPNSRLVATHWIGGVCQLWNAQTGQRVGPLLTHGGVGDDPGTFFPWAAAFSPNGKLLATGARDGAVGLWEVESGHLIAALEHPGEIQTVAFSRDDTLLASGSTIGTVRLWDVATRKPHGATLIEKATVKKVHFSPDGKLLATIVFDDGTAGLWHTDSGQLHARIQHRRWISDLAFSPDGKFLATASADWTVRLWHTSTGEAHGKPMRHNGRVRSVTFSPDGQLLASSSVDQTARLWETGTGKQIGQALFNPGSARRVEFSRDGSQLVVTSGGACQVWRVDRPTLAADAQTSVEPGHGILSPDGRIRAVIDTNGIAELHDAATGMPLGIRMGKPIILAIAWSPDSRRLATGSADWRARLWDVSSGKLVQEIRCRERVYGVAFRPDGKLLATALLSGTVELWDVDSGHRNGLELQHAAPVWDVAFSPDGKLLATASGDEGPSQLTIWSLATDPPYLGLLLPLKAAADKAAFRSFSNNGTLYVAGANSRDVRLWRLPQAPTDPEVWRLRTAVALGVEHDLAGQAVAISPNRWRALRDELNSWDNRSPLGTEK